jgi:hypothetical protein
VSAGKSKLLENLARVEKRQVRHAKREMRRRSNESAARVSASSAPPTRLGDQDQRRHPVRSAARGGERSDHLPAYDRPYRGA